MAKLRPEQADDGFATEKEAQNQSAIYFADSGAADAYVITPDPAISDYVAGQAFEFNASAANTGVSTLNVNSKGAKTIKKMHDQDLVAGDIESGQIVRVVYDGTNFQMESQVATSSAPSFSGGGIGEYYIVGGL